MEFIFAKITRSRLMGSLGLHIQWKVDEKKQFDQFFILDSEGIGLSDYVFLKNATPKEINFQVERLMHGFGEDKVSINKEDALDFLSLYVQKSLDWKKPLPEPSSHYINLVRKINEKRKEELFFKSIKPITNPIEFVNYMTMRFIARDSEALYHYSKNKFLSKMHLTKINGSFLKNKVFAIGNNKYKCETIYDDGHDYYKATLGISIEKDEKLKEFKLSSILISKVDKLDPLKALMLISRSEYVGVYKILSDSFSKKFINKFPHAQSSFFRNGLMLTEFKENNQHVCCSDYLISDDILSLYFFNECNQLLVSNYSETDRIEIDSMLQDLFEDDIELITEYVFSGSFMYSYAESDIKDFFDYLN